MHSKVCMYVDSIVTKSDIYISYDDNYTESIYYLSGIYMGRERRKKENFYQKLLEDGNQVFL